jgi:hypothetical protein
LGRVKDGVEESLLRKLGAAVEGARPEPPVEMTVDGLCLFRSVLQRSGAEYSVLYRTRING